MCLPTTIAKYRKKLSGPFLDRIDLFSEVPRLPKEKLIRVSEDDVSLENVRKHMVATRELQQKRYGKMNSELRGKELKTIPLTKDAGSLLEDAYDRLHLSPRTYFRLIKISRTIADLEENETVEASHVSEALQYRFPSA